MTNGFNTIKAHMDTLRAAKKATPRAWRAFTEYEDVGSVLLDIVGQVVCSVDRHGDVWEAEYDGRRVPCATCSEARERAEEMARADGWDIDPMWGAL